VETGTYSRFCNSLEKFIVLCTVVTYLIITFIMSVRTYYPEVFSNDCIRYEKDDDESLTFQLVQVFGGVDKTTKILNRTRGSTTECYTVLFDKDDADFEIKIDNFLQSNVICHITVGNYSSSSSFFIRTGDTLWLKTLKSEGKHLHFTSQNTEQGKSMVQMRALADDITYNEAAVKCSRIRFDIKVEKMNGLKSSERMSKMTVSVRILAGRTINVEVYPADTVQTLKFILQMIHSC